MKSKRICLILGLPLLLALASGIGSMLYGQGTLLSVAFTSDPVVLCNESGAGATVTFNYTVTSTAAADAAKVTAELDGSDPFVIQEIASGPKGWTFDPPNRTADGSYTVILSNGTHTLTICAAQHGANGNPDKMSCSELVTVAVECGSASCHGSDSFFGEIPHNKNLCSNNANVEIQFRGDFGDTAYLTIVGPNDKLWYVPVSRAGNSCNYHFNWETRNGNNDGPGIYHFYVNRTSQGYDLYTWEELKCVLPPQK